MQKYQVYYKIIGTMKIDLTKLPLEEKIKLLVGKKDTNMFTEDLNGKVHSVSMSDGPTGPHYPNPLLWLPSITALANSWNPDLVEKYVNALSDICVLNNCDMLLGPSVNIKKNPLCGRNFEYFSEDPFLTGMLASRYVNTLQNRGISACVKHFAANNREYARLTCSSDMDLRTLREIYTKQFEMIINEANPWAIMCSYNQINGEFVSENKFVLDDVLRKKLHYENVIVSDWGAVHDRGKSLEATLDLEMPYPAWTDPFEAIKNALKEGKITEENIDRSLTRISGLIDRILEAKNNRFVIYDDVIRHQIAVETCLEGAVLLKNEDDILPLKNDKKIAVVGWHAIYPELNGGGSCNLGDDPFGDFDKSFNVAQVSVPDLLKEKLPNSEIEYVDGYQCHFGFGYHYRIFGNISVDNIVKKSDITLIFVGTNRTIECEGYDRENLNLDSMQLDVIKQITKITNNVVVVIEAGGVIDTSSFENDVKGIIYMPFGGEATNEAITDLLVGKVSPSGKLTESFINDISINPYIHERDMYNEKYDDRVFVGYRLYETKNIKVNYPFGFGLSYTKFEYKNLAIRELGNNEFEVSFDVSNIGNFKGKEISQIYINGSKVFADRPIKELVGFAKSELDVRETKKVTIKLDKKSFAYFDEKKNDWYTPTGEYLIYVGASVKDIKLQGKVIIKD